MTSKNLTGNALLDALLSIEEVNPRFGSVVDSKSGQVYSAADVLRLSRTAATRLVRNGGVAGDYVIVSVPIGIDFITYCYGAFIAGMVPALLDPTQSAQGLNQCIEELGAPIWICNDKPASSFRGAVLEPAGLDKNVSEAVRVIPRLWDILDPVLMLYTSGTTGVPKGVPWTSRELASQMAYYRSEAIQSEFCLFPHLALVAVAMGRKAVLPNLVTTQPASLSIADAHSQMVTHGCDYVFASPPFWSRMADYLRSGNEPPPIRVGATAGAAVSANLISSLKKVMPDTTFRVPYASTEALMPITIAEDDEIVRNSDQHTSMGRGVLLGKPTKGMSVAIIDSGWEGSRVRMSDECLPEMAIGEIIVCGSRVTRSYFQRPGIEGYAKLRDPYTDFLWHRTGDIGYVDSHGKLWYLCRKKDVIHSPRGTLYPDALEQMWNLITGATLSAVVYSEDSDSLYYVLPDSFAQNPIDVAGLNRMALAAGVPDPEVVVLPSSLPADARHNSKVDRQEVLSIVVSLVGAL